MVGGPGACTQRCRLQVGYEHAYEDRYPHHKQRDRQVGYPPRPVDQPTRDQRPARREARPRDSHRCIPVENAVYGHRQPQGGGYPHERTEGFGVGPSRSVHLLGTPSYGSSSWTCPVSHHARLGVWPSATRVLLAPIHRSAWKGNSANFAVREFLKLAHLNTMLRRKSDSLATQMC